MTIRYDELLKSEKELWDSLSEDAQHQMIISTDITFESYILASIKEGDIVEIDYNNKKFEVVSHY